MKIGDILVSKGVITAEQLATLLAEQAKSGERLGDLVVKLGFNTKDKVEAALA